MTGAPPSHGVSHPRAGRATRWSFLLTLVATPVLAAGSWVSPWWPNPPGAAAGAARDCAAYLRLMARGDSLYALGLPPTNREVAQLLGAERARIERAFGPESEEACEAWYLEARGIAYSNTKPAPESRALLERALQWRLDHSGTQHPRVPSLLLVLTRWHAYAGEVEQARAIGLRAIELTEALVPRDSTALSRALSNVGGLLMQVGDRDVAVELTKRALAIRRAKHAPAVQMANTLGNLCALHITRNEPRDAEPYCDEAYELIMRSEGPDGPHTSDAAINLASVRDLLGDTESAIRLNEQSLRIRRVRYGADYYTVGQVHASLAFIHLRTRALDLARQQFREAARVFEASLAPSQPDALAALEGLGRTELAAGRLLQADSAFREVVARVPPGVTRGMPEVVTRALAGLAELHAARGEYAQARAALARADSMLLPDHGPEHVTRRVVLMARADVERTAGRWDSALAAARLACRIDRQHTRFTLQAMPEEDIVRFRDVQSPAIAPLLRLAAAAPGDHALAAAAWDEAIRSRGLGRREFAARLQMRIEPDDLAGQALAVRSRAAAKRADLAVSGDGPTPPESLAVRLRAAEDAGRELARHLAARAGTASLVSGDHEPGFEHVRAALPPHTALVAIERMANADAEPGPERYVALVVAGSPGHAVIVPLPASATVDRTLREWRDAVERSAHEPAAAADATRAGRWLARELWRPVHAACGAAERVYVVAEGELQTLQPMAWPAPGGGDALDSAPLVQLLAAETDVLRAPHASTAPAALLVVGGVDYGARPAAAIASMARAAPAVRAAEHGFAPLPGSAAEASVVERAWRRAGGVVELLSGADATAAAFVRRAPLAGVLHVASHAWSYDPKPGGEIEPGPLRRVGIAFAGANQPGAAASILTGTEIAALDLHGVELVVISACRSALGVPISGEGLLGLRSAFQTAGVPVVISSLWNIGDETSAFWMQSFYEALRTSGDPARAARQAALATRARLRSQGRPGSTHAWGAFVVFGVGPAAAPPAR